MRINWIIASVDTIQPRAYRAAKGGEFFSFLSMQSPSGNLLLLLAMSVSLAELESAVEAILCKLDRQWPRGWDVLRTILILYAKQQAQLLYALRKWCACRGLCNYTSDTFKFSNIGFCHLCALISP